MNKAILVVDIPKEFENREPYFVEGSLFCYVKTNYGKYRYVCDLDKTKLKPMPQRKDESRAMYGGKDYIVGTRIDEHAKGWNACIDEIVGKENA